MLSTPPNLQPHFFQFCIKLCNQRGFLLHMTVHLQYICTWYIPTLHYHHTYKHIHWRAYSFEIVGPVDGSFEVFLFPAANFIRPTILENSYVSLCSLQQRLHLASPSPAHACVAFGADHCDVMWPRHYLPALIESPFRARQCTERAAALQNTLGVLVNRITIKKWHTACLPTSAGRENGFKSTGTVTANSDPARLRVEGFGEAFFCD